MEDIADLTDRQLVDLYGHLVHRRGRGKASGRSEGRPGTQPGWEGFRDPHDDDTGLGREDGHRIGADASFEDAVKVATAFAHAIGWSKEQIDELIARKRREHEQRQREAAGEPADPAAGGE